LPSLSLFSEKNIKTKTLALKSSIFLISNKLFFDIA
jgi:hypothetical protein